MGKRRKGEREREREGEGKSSVGDVGEYGNYTI